jgi:hypothetical protein
MLTETRRVTLPPPGQVATPKAEQTEEAAFRRLATRSRESATGRPARREPDRWLPLLLFILAVVLSFDYHLFGLG